MASSAFRSTTKRSSLSGSRSGTADTHAVTSTPRSKRDPSPSPSGRGSHRRSTSMTDFSARYLSDCASTSASYSRSTNVQGGHRPVCPTDSESEWDSLSVHRPRRRWAAKSEDERPHGNLHLKASEFQHKGFKRALSSQELSQHSKKEGSRKHTSPRNSFSGRNGLNRAGGSTEQFYRLGSSKTSGGRKPAMAEAMSDKLSSITGMFLFTDEGHMGQEDHHLLDLDMVLLDRIQFRCRVDNGELLLCQGALLL